MALVPLAPAEDRLSTVMPARAKARTFLQRSVDLSPEPREVLRPYTANQSGEVALLRQQLLESHSRVETLTQYVVQAMGMIEEREAWWRSTASASLEERAVQLKTSHSEGSRNTLLRTCRPTPTTCGRQAKSWSGSISRSGSSLCLPKPPLITRES